MASFTRDQTFLELDSKSAVHVSVNKQICTAGHENNEKCWNGKTWKIESPTILYEVIVIQAGNNRLKIDATVTNYVFATSATSADCQERFTSCILT